MARRVVSARSKTNENEDKKKRGKKRIMSVHRRYNTSVLAPILRRRAIALLHERHRDRSRAVGRLTRWRGQRVARRQRGRAVRGADARYVRQIGIAPDPARKLVQRPLQRLRERLRRLLQRRKLRRRYLRLRRRRRRR